jgi:hypothetical protein
MRYYVVRENDESKIMKVQEHCLCTFLRYYSGKILFASCNLQEIKVKISEYKVLADKMKRASETLWTINEYRFNRN